MSEGGSSDEYPAICDVCCGENKYLKLIRQVNGEECKICTRPFTVFRWKTEAQASKHRKTVICMTCSRARNCCQSCMLDINYGIPIDLRDTALKMAGLDKEAGFLSGTKSKNREVKAISAERDEERFRRQDVEDGGTKEKAREILEKLAFKFKSNSNNLVKKAPKLESRSKPVEIAVKSSDLSRLLKKLPFGGRITIPQSDPTLASFFIYGFTQEIPQYIVSGFCQAFGKIKSISLIQRARCGYITFASRTSAESFASSIENNGLNENKDTSGVVLIDNKYLMRVAWGKPMSLGTTNEDHYKLSLVAAKVMKQLAEKDVRALNKPSKSDSVIQQDKKKTSFQKPFNEKTPNEKKPATNKNKYKTLNADFEL